METTITNAKRLLENGRQDDEETEESPETKRRRVLEATRDIDADSDGDSDGSSTDERFALHDLIVRATTVVRN